MRPFEIERSKMQAPVQQELSEYASLEQRCASLNASIPKCAESLHQLDDAHRRASLRLEEAIRNAESELELCTAEMSNDDATSNQETGSTKRRKRLRQAEKGIAECVKRLGQLERERKHIDEIKAQSERVILVPRQDHGNDCDDDAAHGVIPDSSRMQKELWPSNGKREMEAVGDDDDCGSSNNDVLSESAIPDEMLRAAPAYSIEAYSSPELENLAAQIWLLQAHGSYFFTSRRTNSNASSPSTVLLPIKRHVCVSADMERIEWRAPDAARSEGFVRMSKVQRVELRTRGSVPWARRMDIKHCCGEESSSNSDGSPGERRHVQPLPRVLAFVLRDGAVLKFLCSSVKEETLWYFGLRALIFHLNRKGGSSALRCRLRRRQGARERYLTAPATPPSIAKQKKSVREK